MTDVHSHIMFDVDDGCSSIEESIELLKRLKEVGFDNIILTPHYIEGSEYSITNNEKLKKLDILRAAARENGIDINIYLGNEIFINENIILNIEKGNIYSLNGTRYLLIEFPFHNKIINLEDMIFEIRHAGYIPVIAHPERYTYFQEDHALVDSLRDSGVMFQANYASILGFYGKGAEKLLKYMLKKRYIDFLGTDIHHVKKSFVIDNFAKIEKKINKITGKDYYKEIVSNGNSLI